MPTNRKEHVRFRYGICLNDGCSKCKSKEVQQIAARKDFVCEECQKPLRECPPPKSFWDKYGKLTIGASVVAAIVAGVFIVPMLLPGNTDETIENPPHDSDNNSWDIIEAAPDSIVKLETDTTSGGGHADGGRVDTTITPPPVPSIQVPFGTYSGPANGLNGKITVTRSYTLDLRNAAHESIDLLPGDVITSTQFKDGELVSGYWQRGSEKRIFHR